MARPRRRPHPALDVRQHPVILLLAVCGVLASAPTRVAAQQLAGPVPAAAPAAPTAPPDGLPFAIDGPSPPVPPAVVTRDATGRATIRAVRLDTPLRLDGALDDPLYQQVAPVGGFVQVEPIAGRAPSENTDVWVAYDSTSVYISIRCWDSEPDRRIATEMRRDVSNYINGNDIVNVFIDPFYDHRNGMSFTVNSIGARNDGQQIGNQYNGDWNPIWNHAVGRFDGGWAVEMVIPFRSLRYRPGRAQVWGLNVMRTVRWKNEISVLSPVPPGRGNGSAQYAPLTATVVGLEAPPVARNLDVKPFGIATQSTNRTAAPGVSTFGRDAGLDVKYGITQNLVADLTYNTDFAQVEADEQQLNLTRFNLFFPEKRDFFLENRDTFNFGGVALGGQAPVLFYSRRIGLDDGRVVPIETGGRLTGRVGRYSVGVLDIQTGEATRAATLTAPALTTPGTNFGVLRLKRDILRQSSVGAIYTRRSVGVLRPGVSEAYGVDGAFNFYNDLSINTYWARTPSDQGPRGNDVSYRANLNFPGDRYGVQLERMRVDGGFNPEMGFVRRAAVRRTLAELRFSPRPRRRLTAVRRFWGQATVDYFENSAGRVEYREQSGEFAVEFQNADRLSVKYLDLFEFIPATFRIAGVPVPVGGYDWRNLQLAMNFSPQRALAGSVTFEHGTFYAGDRTALTIARGRIAITPRFATEPTYTLNHVSLPTGTATTHLAGSRVIYTMTPRMFTSALVQFNSTAKTLSANVRLRWEYQPGSELFVVYNDERNTLTSGFPRLLTRSLVVKVNRLFRF